MADFLSMHTIIFLSNYSDSSKLVSELTKLLSLDIKNKQINLNDKIS